MNDKQQLGNVIEVVLIAIVVVVLIGLAAWLATRDHTKTNVSTNKSVAQSDTQKPASSDTKTATSPYAGWKTYCDQPTSNCFKYPSDWTLTTSTTVITSATVRNPANRVIVSYSNPDQKDAGVGRFFTMVIHGLADGDQSLKIVGGFFPANDLPGFCLTDSATVSEYGLVAGQYGSFVNSATCRAGLQAARGA